MKGLLIFVFIISSIVSYGQKITQVQLADAATLTDNDTTVWILMKNLEGRYLSIYYTELDGITDTLDVGMSNNDSTYQSTGTIFGVSFPVILDKSHKTQAEGTDSYSIGVDSKQWNAKYAVFKFSLGVSASTEGKVYLQY
jgi:hypothetical protein